MLDAIAEAGGAAVDIVAEICGGRASAPGTEGAGTEGAGTEGAGSGPLPLGGEWTIRATLAALACDALLAVLPCPVGLDPATAVVWEAAAEAGLPRAVLVTGLAAEGAPDFEDLAAIAERALGSECLPARLPVWDDGNVPAASLNLADLTIAAPHPVPADPEHAAVAAPSRDALVAALSVLADDAFAASVSVGLTPGGVDSELGAALVRGELAPIWPDTSDGAWAGDLMGALKTGAGAGLLAAPADRLVRRDAQGDPGTGSAAVVIASPERNTCLVRSVFGELPAQGAVVVTCCGPDGLGRPQPYRSWPTAIEDLPAPAAALAGAAGLRAVRSVMAALPGEVLADSQTWLLPAAQD